MSASSDVSPLPSASLARAAMPMSAGLDAAHLQAPVAELPLTLPQDWDLLDLDQRVRRIGEW